MSLTTYSEAAAFRDAIEFQVESGEMPPWPPSNTCNTYKHDRSLTQHEKDTLLNWARQGAPQGIRPVTPVTPTDFGASGLSRVDLTVTMPTEYTPVPFSSPYDDQRCILVDWPLTTTMYVKGMEVIPGNERIVHHVAVLTVDPENVDKFEALDAAEDGPGWSCYSGIGENIDGGLGGWTPGMRAVELPAHMGREMRPGSKILLHMHYNLLFANSGPDQTSLRFKLDDAPGGFAFTTPVARPEWLGGKMPIKAGDPHKTYSFEWEPTMLIGPFGSIRFYNANIHMHQLGKSARLEIRRQDGTTDCLLDIPRWNFLWENEFWFEEVQEIRKGDKLYVECVFDNSAENQPVVNGTQLEPQDINWGGNAPNEMCAGLLLSVVGF